MLDVYHPANSTGGATSFRRVSSWEQLVESLEQQNSPCVSVALPDGQPAAASVGAVNGSNTRMN